MGLISVYILIKKAHVEEEMKCETFAEGVYIVHVGGPIPMRGGGEGGGGGWYLCPLCLCNVNQF